MFVAKMGTPLSAQETKIPDEDTFAGDKSSYHEK
jgi:hypothetical protein